PFPPPPRTGHPRRDGHPCGSSRRGPPHGGSARPCPRTCPHISGLSAPRLSGSFREQPHDEFRCITRRHCRGPSVILGKPPSNPGSNCCRTITIGKEPGSFRRLAVMHVAQIAEG